MAGAVLEVNSSELTALTNRLNRFFGKLRNPQEAMRKVSGLLVSQTKTRIVDEKASADGTPWAEWSDNYAKTRHANKSKLRDEDNLLKSISPDSGNSFSQAFTEMVYGRTHQEGFNGVDKLGRQGNTPARPYFGISVDNAEEIEEVFAAWVERAL